MPQKRKALSNIFILQKQTALREAKKRAFSARDIRNKYSLPVTVRCVQQVFQEISNLVYKKSTSPRN